MKRSSSPVFVRAGDFYSWKYFMDDVKAADATGGLVSVHLEFRSELLGEDNARLAKCDITIDPETTKIWLTPGNDLFQRRFPCRT